jgi:hypothetical protein
MSQLEQIEEALQRAGFGNVGVQQPFAVRITATRGGQYDRNEDRSTVGIGPAIDRAIDNLLTICRSKPQELEDLLLVFAARLMFALLPIEEGTFVYAKGFPAFQRCHSQIEAALLDLLADMPGNGWIQVGFP